MGVIESVHVAALSGKIHRRVHVLTCMDKNSAEIALHKAGQSLPRAYRDAPPDSSGANIAGQAVPRAKIVESAIAQDEWVLQSGLGTAQAHADAMELVADTYPDSKFMFVTNSVRVARAIASRLRLGAVSLYFSTWGPQDHLNAWSDARSWLPRVKELRSATDFERLLQSAQIKK